jgi:hypothetical protein
MGRARVWAFLLAERTEIRKKLEDPAYLHIICLGKVPFSKETEYRIQDSEGVVVFDTEFSISFTSHKSKKSSRPKILTIELGICRAAVQRVVLGQWQFDLAAFPNPESEDLRQSTTTLHSGVPAVLYFRLVIRRPKSFPGGAPRVYFERHIGRRIQTVAVDGPVPSDPPPSSGGLSEVLMSNDSTAQLPIPSQEPRSSVSNEEIDPNRRHLLRVVTDLRQTLSQIVFDQCSVDFTKAVISAFYQHNIACDVSDLLVRPIRDYQLFAISDLTADTITSFLSPLVTAIVRAIDNVHPIAEVFAILSSVLHFGLKMSSEAVLYTTLHFASLRTFEDLIDRICLILRGSLVAMVAQSGVSQLGDQENFKNLRTDTCRFLAVARELGIPEPLLEMLVVDCCRTVDTLLFNAIVEGDDIFDVKMVSDFTKRIRDIQDVFQCISDHFVMAFDSLLQMIGIAELFLGGVELNRIGEPNPLVRLIVERCRPKIVLPFPLTLDRLGPKVAEGSELRIDLSDQGFKFTFEWLVKKNFNVWG